MVRIVFTASDTLGGKLIRWFTRSRVSHVMIQYESKEWGGDWIAEATAVGVRKVPAEKARNHVVAEYACLFDAKDHLRDLRQYIGEHFDFGGIAIFAWAIVAWRVFGKKIRAPHRSSKAQFCSELVARFLEQCGLRSPGGGLIWHYEQESPDTLLQYCEEQHMQFKEIS